VDLVSDLPALPQRTSTAEAAAELLRDQITRGRIRPGAQLREEQVAAALAISRNTVREAFRLLSHERLVDHALHRGVFVREVSVDDIRAMYVTRRLVTPLAVDACLADPAAVDRLAAVVDRGAAAAARGDWEGVGTADIDFHRTLMGACASPHLTTMYARLLAELRLAFLRMDQTQLLHEPFLARNGHLVDLLRAGDRAAALAEVEDYLRTAERTLVAALPASP
jgi:DNA-binding GntR family transcriptional regulator